MFASNGSLFLVSFLYFLELVVSSLGIIKGISLNFVFKFWVGYGYFLLAKDRVSNYRVKQLCHKIHWKFTGKRGLRW